MKIPFLFVATLFVATQSAFAGDLVVALSPYQKTSEAKVQMKQLFNFLTRLDAGQQANIIDGFHLKTIGTFKVPESASYKSPRIRMKINRASVSAIRRFMESTSNTGNNVPSVSQAVRLPQLLKYVAETYPSEGELDVIVLGSPLYDDPKESEFSMADGLIPSDGHLLATGGTTPFGTVDTTNLLSNIRLHMGFNADNSIQNNKHEYLLKRFWTLFMEKQGGTLVTFTSSVSSLFSRVQRNAKPIKYNYKLKASKKLEMMRLRREKIEESIYERPVSQIPMLKRTIRYANDLELALSWDCDCDIDLYARPHSNSDILFFNQKTSSEGTHWRDYLVSPRHDKAYETIEFHVPIDLRKLKIVANFYEGSAPQGVNIEFRLAVNGQTYAERFKIKATKGNKGDGVGKAFQTGLASSTHMLVIDPLKIVGAL